MGIFSAESALESFRIVVDTREQMTPRAKHRLNAFGVPYERGTLNFGDYAANITLPSGDLLDLSQTISAKCVIERKMSLDEMAACLGRERKRFERELIRAKDAGASLYLVIEDGSWEKITAHNYRSKLSPDAFYNSLVAYQCRYGIRVLFASQLASPRLIKEILYRDIKERVTNGEIKTE